MGSVATLAGLCCGDITKNALISGISHDAADLPDFMSCHLFLHKTKKNHKLAKSFSATLAFLTVTLTLPTSVIDFTTLRLFSESLKYVKRATTFR